MHDGQEEKVDADVASVRDFNRFYTARFGLLRARHLDAEFSLTEARILYEIGANPDITASLLRNTLYLDAGYLSRLLSNLAKKRLLQQRISKRDARERLLRLTAAGKRAAIRLDAQSSQQVKELLGELNTEDQSAVVRALAQVHSILRRGPNRQIQIVRLSVLTEDAFSILEEYYKAVQVIKRDEAITIQATLDDGTSGLWLATRGTETVGCVMLRRLTSMPEAVECKRLYVKPSARGQHVAERLLEALENYAQMAGTKWIYLDTHAGLNVAIALYRKHGYKICDRYNDNPQATLFMRKALFHRLG